MELQEDFISARMFFPQLTIKVNNFPSQNAVHDIAYRA